MITFACSACQKKLSVKDELAGKKAKCPGCGQMAAIPAPVVSAANAEMATIQPSLRPARADRDEPTNADAMQRGNKPEASRDSSLTDFLSPPQTGDELGRLGKYRILKILGRGGMGVVFQAEDPKLKRSVAVKAMLPSLAASASDGKRFLREAQAMAAVKHDHIVTIYQVDEERGVPFLAMEFLTGEPLDVRLKREGKLPLADVLRIGREIAEGLNAAHATCVIHRDVKPANIWLEAPKNRVKILDFGLARASAQDAGLTQDGEIIGTPAFMSPEQARGEAVDSRCDLFSLGVVLYLLCTGEYPFKGRNAITLLMEVTMHQPAPPIQLNPKAPQELSDLVMKLLEKKPDQRPASAGVVVEVLQALERNLARQRNSRENTQTVTAPGTKGVAVPRRRRLPLVLAAVLMLGGLIGVGAFTLIPIQSDYIIDTDDPDFSFRVSKGTVTLEDSKTKHKYVLNVLSQKKATGEHELEATEAPDLTFKTKTFTIKRGEKVALKAWFERKQEVAAKGTSVEDPWLKEVAGMPAAKQVQAVAQRLQELNPGFDGKVTHEIEGGAVTELEFLTDKVTDLSPVRALTRLRTLQCYGTWASGRLADLSPLKDLKLTLLYCHHTEVKDLSPLKSMKLTQLNCGYTKVSDLSPLKDMKLRFLYCGGTKVSNLSPLKDMKLTTLHCQQTPVADLSPLKDMKLNFLWCYSAKVTDLSPLRGLPLVELCCDFRPDRDAEILRSIKTLETINDKPAKEFWKKVEKKSTTR